jgi:hypothetical protein
MECSVEVVLAIFFKAQLGNVKCLITYPLEFSTFFLRNLIVLVILVNHKLEVSCIITIGHSHVSDAIINAV